MDDSTDVVAAVEDLFDAIKSKDVERIQGRYLQDERLLVFLEGPESKVEGWDQQSNAAEWNALLDVVTFTDIRLEDDCRAGRDGDLGWVGSTMTLRYRGVDGGPEVSTSNRGTWIAERHGDRWLIVFEHVSFPKEDPYPAEND